MLQKSRRLMAPVVCRSAWRRSSCSNIYDKAQFARMLRHNFNRHYQTNRAPLSLSFDAAWLQVNKGFTRVLADFVSELLEEHNDVYFLTETQVILA